MAHNLRVPGCAEENKGSTCDNNLALGEEHLIAFMGWLQRVDAVAPTLQSTCISSLTFSDSMLHISSTDFMNEWCAVLQMDSESVRNPLILPHRATCAAAITLHAVGFPRVLERLMDDWYEQVQAARVRQAEHTYSEALRGLRLKHANSANVPLDAIKDEDLDEARLVHIRRSIFRSVDELVLHREEAVQFCSERAQTHADVIHKAVKCWGKDLFMDFCETGPSTPAVASKTESGAMFEKEVAELFERIACRFGMRVAVNVDLQKSKDVLDIFAKHDKKVRPLRVRMAGLW